MGRYQANINCRKRKYQIAGFWLFPIINAIILALSDAGRNVIAPWFIGGALGGLTAGGEPVSSQFTEAWIINGFVVVAALTLEPQVAVGYLISLAGLIAGSLLYTISCLATCALLEPTLDSTASLAFLIVFPFVFWGVWLILGVVGSVWLYRQACDDELE